VAIVQFIIGVALLALGGTCVVRREQIVARQRRSSAGQVQSPAAFVVIGTILALAGLLQVVLALG
jgi:hypothetical protein